MRCRSSDPQSSEGMWRSQALIAAAAALIPKAMKITGVAEALIMVKVTGIDCCCSSSDPQSTEGTGVAAAALQGSQAQRLQGSQAQRSPVGPEAAGFTGLAAVLKVCFGHVILAFRPEFLGSVLTHMALQHCNGQWYGRRSILKNDQCLSSMIVFNDWLN